MRSSVVILFTSLSIGLIRADPGLKSINFGISQELCYFIRKSVCASVRLVCGDRSEAFIVCDGSVRVKGTSIVVLIIFCKIFFGRSVALDLDINRRESSLRSSMSNFLFKENPSGNKNYGFVSLDLSIDLFCSTKDATFLQLTNEKRPESVIYLLECEFKLERVLNCS